MPQNVSSVDTGQNTLLEVSNRECGSDANSPSRLTSVSPRVVEHITSVGRHRIVCTAEQYCPQTSLLRKISLEICGSLGVGSVRAVETITQSYASRPCAALPRTISIYDDTTVPTSAKVSSRKQR